MTGRGASITKGTVIYIPREIMDADNPREIIDHGKGRIHNRRENYKWDGYL